MNKRVGMWLAVATSTGVALGMVAPAQGSSDGSRTFSVVSRHMDQEFVDTPPKNKFNAGDQFVFSSKLSRGGTVVGRSGVVCTAVGGKPQAVFCEGAIRLKRGQIVAEGLQVGSPDTFSIAVVGGTGAFEGARGSMMVEGSGPRERWTFHLLP